MIYLDCHATTPPSPAVVRAVLAAMSACGNAHSAHLMGRAAAERVEAARRSVAALLGEPEADNVVFTSGATEANNMLLRGAIEAARERLALPHVLAGAAEHSSVLAPLRAAAARGEIDFETVPVRDAGAVRVGCVERRLRPETVLVALQAANNEVGAVNDLAAVGELCGRRGVLLHADLCQSFGRVPVPLDLIDSASMSAHKLYGPTGVGALWARPDVWAWLRPQTLGGGQERGRRAGTTNVHGAAGFGAACDEMRETWANGAGPEPRRLKALRDAMLRALRAELGDEVVRVNGPLDPEDGPAVRRLAHNLNVTLRGVDGPTFHALARESVCVSAASACKALGGTRSHVLEAMGVPDDGAVMRVGMGSTTTEADVLEAVRCLVWCARQAAR